MDKKQVTDLRSGLIPFTFWCEVYFHYRRIKRFPLHEMRDDVAFQIINDELIS